jgi:CRP-like cAMP-binding protein
VVLKGKVDITKNTPKGDILIASLGPGEFLGEMSLFDEEPRSATAHISEEAFLVVITKKCFNDMMRSDPHITSKLLLRFLKSVNDRLRKTNKKFE